MTRPEAGFLLSTGSVGAFNLPGHVEEIYGFLKKDSYFLGLETIGWWWVSFILPGLQQREFKTVGLHGRTGSWHESDEDLARFFALVTKSFLMSTPRLAEIASSTRDGDRGGYLLLHGFELIAGESPRFVITNKEKIKMLYVENNLHPDGLEITLRVIDHLKQNGVRVGLAFDLVHYFDSCGGSVKERWVKTVDALASVLDHGELPVILHVPIGQSPDSLPFGQISEDMWRQLANKLAGHNILKVIEDQPDVRNQLFTPRSQRTAQRKRAVKNMASLRTYGVI